MKAHWGDRGALENITWEGCVELSKAILSSPPGDWTHTINGEPVRLERIVLVPGELAKVFFRGKDYGGSWSIAAWEKDAKKIVVYEQMVLF
ncbi:hypothetical protein ACFOLF_12325 [Paenibacillus sepulcri]|uniref:Uncharacterized protein n=1 Tax=Paenibacillus sepulcri TaxID=359917 RepID=A0ABS7BUX7_9BACL|nr:hypothetical protein [Paenibacillus sepulcri]